MVGDGLGAAAAGGELLAVFDRDFRGTWLDQLPASWPREVDGPVARVLTGPSSGTAMLTGADRGLTGSELEAVVERTVAFFAQHGVGFGWRTYDHDPAALRPLLERYDGRPGLISTLMLGWAEALAAGDAEPPDGLLLREVTDTDDFDRIAELHTEVWGEDQSFLAGRLRLLAGRTDPARVLVVDDGPTMVSAAWLLPVAGTRIAGLYGGCTLAAYRHRGIYRALVARRARLALHLGHPVLQVEASDDSRPILQRLGLHAVSGLRTYSWEPAGLSPQR